MCDIKKAFYNLKIDEKAIALRKVWLPIDKEGRIAFGKHIDEVHWEVHTFTSSAMGDIGAPALLFLTICKAAEMFCAGNDRMSQWTRLVLITSAYFDDIQAVGTTRKERDEMMEKIDLVLKKSGMLTHPWTVCNPTGKEMPAVAPTSDEIANFPKILGYCWSEEHDAFVCQVRVNLFPKKKGAPSGPAL